jgi:excisionase family DNA binding protein
MEILDKKSTKINSFFSTLDELLDTIQQALKNRTPHLNGEKFLTNKDVCRMLQISSRTLQDWRDTGKIPFIQVRGKILYKESEIVKLMEENILTISKHNH